VPAAPAPADAAIGAAAALLMNAERPVLVGGRGAVVSGAGPAIEALAERTGALLATSAVAHGLFAGSAWSLRISGGFATPLAAEVLAQADAIVSFGATLNHWTTRHGALIAEDAKVVAVDVDPAQLGAHVGPDVAIVGDAAATAEALAAAVPAAEARSADEHGVDAGDAGHGWRTAAMRARVAAGRWRDVPYAPGATPDTVDPRALSVALEDLLPPDRIVVVDSGHLTGWPAMFLTVPDARSWLFCNGFQAVGLGLGNAIGAAVAAPDRPVVAAVGDGGLFLALAELETAARIGARLLVLVYDDEAYGAEVHHFAPQGRDVSGARFPPVDVAGLARAAGCAALTVRSVDDLAPVADWRAGPLVVDAKVDPTVCADWLAEAFRGG
jgi:thiamine pyrophosphate-dependent acetolactate synthase large subunit-like protein